MLIEMTKRHEGLRLEPYKDTVGKLTVGYGHNLDDKPISLRTAEVMLEDDLNDAREDIERYSWYQEQTDIRKDVLVMMSFNLGLPRLLRFKKMIKALIDYDYQNAADEMLDSRWADQVGNRAIELSRIMRTGGWSDG